MCEWVESVRLVSEWEAMLVLLTVDLLKLINMMNLGSLMFSESK